MPQFDFELWKSRAHRRFAKACAEGRKSNKLIRDMASIEKLAIVVSWCEERKLEVFFGKGPNGEYHHDERFITINGRLAPESQLFVLLHECGHALIGERHRKERYGNGYSASELPHVQKTLLYRIDVVDEELEAWHRGLKLARRLGIEVNVDRYNRTRAEYVKSYLQWATQPANQKRMTSGIQT